MRLALVTALLVALVMPMAASASRTQNPAVCRRIAQQLVHYDAMRARADDQGSAVWAKRFDAHLSKLEDDFAARCPEQAAQQQSIQQLAALLKNAGRTALSFFTLGMY
jgi:hypothetical protein